MVDHITVRNVDEQLWLQFRAEAVRRNVSVGALLNDAIRAWLERQAEQDGRE